MTNKKECLTKWSVFACALLFLPILSSGQIKDKITINGYSSFEFEYQFDEVGKGDRNASFDADLFDIVLNVKPTDKLRIAADITWEHGTATEEAWGNAAIEYAFPEYTFKPWLKLRVGKMFVPFGIYNEIHTAKPSFLATKEPLSTNKNHKMGSDERFYPRWANGVSFVGKFKLKDIKLDYNLQLSNGYQESTNPYEEDDNQEKAIAARLRMSPKRGTKLGFSSYTDWLTELDSLGEDAGTRTLLYSYGFFLEHKIKNLGIELEYVGGAIDPSDADPLQRYGTTAMLSYTIKEKFTPYFRHEWLDPNIDVGKDEAMISSIGINYQIDTGYFIKVQYNYVDGRQANDRFNGMKFSETQIALVAAF